METNVGLKPNTVIYCINMENRLVKIYDKWLKFMHSVTVCLGEAIHVQVLQIYFRMIKHYERNIAWD